MTLADLNAMPDAAAKRELTNVCGSTRWVAAMSARRPFKSADDLFDAASEVWMSLEGADWLEAFSHHPRIGERAGGWAKDEQGGTRGAPDRVMRALADGNHEYERKFGHVFLICATGRSADEMLAQLQRRIDNEPATELRVAAAEQAKITRLRLEKLLASSPTASRTP
jgi:2-oxo-4-hydroxy-4-carboxy-5-ureidoimidazoline decarboxylase